MTDEPNDPMRDLVATKDQYLTTYREMFIPMFKEMNEMMKEAGFEVEIRAVIIGRSHERFTEAAGGTH